MMAFNRNFIKYIVILSIVMVGCKRLYHPPTSNNNYNYLVVDGIINTGNDSTVIKLTRTTNVSTSPNSVFELKAKVTIVDDQNQSYSLTERGKGVYVSPVLNLSNSHNYKLNILTSDGQTYVSDFVPAKPTPVIDSIGFTTQNGGMQIYINTHDGTNNTRYYRWDYEETWQFHANDSAEFITDGTQIVPRTSAQSIYSCFGSDTSSTIVLGTSSKLSQDVIYQNPIIFIPSTSEKIEKRYSIFIREYAVTLDGYNYYTQLKKNTEQLGSIFDAQPSQLTGNVHCTSNPDLIAIGYVTAGTIQSKRVFIDKSELPVNWHTEYPYTCALQMDYYTNPASGKHDVANILIPGELVPIFSFTGNGGGFDATTNFCADCTLRGTKIKPSFWR